MNIEVKHRSIYTLIRHSIRIAALLLGSYGLVSCGGSGGGASGGGGQSPDPVAVDLAIAYVKRSLPVDEDGNPAIENIREPAAFNEGAELFMRARASSQAPEVNITAGTFAEGELYDVKDVSVSFDGTRLLFAMRAPELDNVDDDDQPTWNIWEYDSTADVLRRLIISDNTAEAGQDVMPRYLSDGRIVFSSTRQRRSRAILLDENKPQYDAQDEDRDTDAFVLHTMAEDGTDIQQISFNQSHDLYPELMDDGRIAFLRWDNVNNTNSLSLYTLNPDGSGLGFLYGFHSQDTGTNGVDATFWASRMLPDGRVLALHKPPESVILGGDLLAIDIVNFTEIDQPLTASSATSTQGQESITALQVNIDGTPSPHGSFASAWPLFDGTERVFVSWSQCRLQDIAMTEVLPCTVDNLARVDVEPAEPLYGLWMYNVIEGSQQPIVVPEEGVMYTDAIVMETRELPDFIPDIVPEAELEQEGTALLNIRSVYDFDGVDVAPGGIESVRDPVQTPPDTRPARFLRIEKAVSIPDDDTLDFDNSAFGVGGRGQLMREIVGYVPIEPDGSVIAKVPADIAIAFSVLDANGRRITQRHENWLHVEVGDTIQCNGCHTQASEIAHGRVDAQPDSANPGAPLATLPFPNTLSALFADEVGETMAETWARINGNRDLSVDIIFDDEWTDPALATPAASLSWTYADLLTEAPASDACVLQWNALCRILINYPMHIQPIWDFDRPIFDDVGVEIENNRCTICHSEMAEDLTDQVPAAQIDLRPVQSRDNADYATSYQELFVQNDAQELDAVGMLQFEMVDSGQVVVDANGDPVLDDMGNPIPILVRVEVDPVMSPGGANASDGFFTVFEPGAAHEDYLTPVELKLISEWLDIGAQYYNNPFDAPLN